MPPRRSSPSVVFAVKGELALSLPDSDVETVWLDFSKEERVLYSLHACADGIPKWADTNRMTETTLADVASGLGKRRGALSGLYSVDVVTGTVSSQGKHYTLGKPGPGGMRQQGCAAYSQLSYDAWTPKPARAAMTKYAALLKDLKSLVAKEKSKQDTVAQTRWMSCTLSVCVRCSLPSGCHLHARCSLPFRCHRAAMCCVR